MTDYDPTTENKTPWENHGIDHDDDNEEKVDTTRPFQPGAASTPYQPQGATAGPYYGGESHEMTDFGPEESGISDTTPLLAQEQRERAWNTITVVRGVGWGHSQISLTTPTNGMLGMWLIGKSLSTSSKRGKSGKFWGQREIL